MVKNSCRIVARGYVRDSMSTKYSKVVVGTNAR
jgi:hypothetical protein